MAVGLIKKEIIHSSKKDSPTKFLGSLFAGKGNKRRLREAEASYKQQMAEYKKFTFENPFS